MALDLVFKDSDLSQTTGTGMGDVAVAEIDGTTYVFSANLTGGSITTFSMTADGTLVPVFDIADAADINLAGVIRLEVVSVGASRYLVATGRDDNGVTTFSVGADGSLTPEFSVTDPAYNLEQANALASATVGGTTYVYVGSGPASEITGFAIDSNGVLSNVTSVADDATLSIAGLTDMTTATIGSTNYLYATGFNDNGVSVFRIENDGSLTNVDNVNDSIHPDYRLEGAIAVETAEVGGNTYLFVSGFDEPGISVFAIGALDGRLTHVSDITGFAGSDLDTQIVDGQPYLVAFSRDGVGYFAIAADGSLAEVGQFLDPSEAEAGDPVTGEFGGTVTVDGTPLLLTTGAFKDVPTIGGVNAYLVRNDLIDDATMAVTVAENTTSVITIAKLDAEDDVTFTIDGGVDASMFVVDPDTGTVSFKTGPDFETPEDSNGDNVYDVIIKADTGLFSETKTLEVEVTNVGGVELKGTKKADTLVGTGEEDMIVGQNGQDDLSGRKGDDLLDGGKKKDKLTGGGGADAFRFKSEFKDAWADKITDFKVGTDLILLDRDVFKNVGKAGALKAKYFDTGKKADSKNDHMLFKDGVIRYDKDGKGGRDAVKVAKVDKGIKLSEDDFMLV